MLIDTRVGRLFVDERGDGPALVLWHSLLCDGGMWRLVRPRLAEHFRTISIDGPGHGRSDAVRRPFSLEECADAVVDVLDAHRVERAHLAGLSWGGMTGMRFALRHPERLDRLALIDTSAHAESRRKLPSYHVMAFVARRVGAIPLLLDRLEPIFFCAKTLRDHPEVVQSFREHLARMDPVSMGHAVDAVIFNRDDLRPRLGEIRSPTLVVVGADDVATPLSRAKAIVAGIPECELLEVRDAGHLSVLEQPEVLAERLITFFSAREPREG